MAGAAAVCLNVGVAVIAGPLEGSALCCLIFPRANSQSCHDTHLFAVIP